MQKLHLPRQALALNPLNKEAATSLLHERLLAAPAPGDVQRLLEQARRLVRLAPADGRSHSLLGLALLRAGRKQEALAAFRAALARAPTEREALVQLIRHDLLNGRLEAVAGRVDVLLRRWREVFANVAPVIRVLVQDERAARRLLEVLAARPAWRGQAVALLLADARGRAFVQRLLLHEQESGRPPPAGDIAATLRAMLNADEVTAAHALFLQTLDARQRREAGPVFDGHFRLGTLQRPFSWQVYRKAAADIRLPWRMGKERGGLLVTFLNMPVSGVLVWQLAVLPAGDYRLEVEVTGRALKLPRGLFWQVRCKRAGVLARVAVPAGTYEGRALQTRVQVPEACKVQELALVSGHAGRLWSNRYRYGGQLLVQRVQMTPLSPQGGAR